MANWIKPKTNIPLEIELLEDEPTKHTHEKYGDYYTWEVWYDDSEETMSITPYLYDLLKGYKKGDALSILKEQNGKTSYEVSIQSGVVGKPVPPKKDVKPDNDTKGIRIGGYALIKPVVANYPIKDRWVEDDWKEIEARLYFLDETVEQYVIDKTEPKPEVDEKQEDLPF